MIERVVPAVPAGLSGNAAQKFTTDALNDLAPYAVRQLEEFLRFGTESRQMEALREVLDRAGFAKQSERVNVSVAPVMVLMPDVLDAPWRRPRVEAPVVNAPPVAARDDEQDDEL